MINFKQGFLEFTIHYLSSTNRFYVLVEKSKLGFFTPEQKKVFFEAANVRDEQHVINVLAYYFKRYGGGAGNWKIHTNFKQIKSLRGDNKMSETNAIYNKFIVVGEFNDNIYSKHSTKEQADNAAVTLTKVTPNKEFLVYEAVTSHKSVLTTESTSLR